MALLCDLHISKSYTWLSCNGNQYGRLTHIQEKSGREVYLKILSVSSVIEVVSFQFMMNTCEYFKEFISYGQTGMLVMPEKSKIPINHSHQCNLSYQIFSVVVFLCHLYPDTSACSLHGANLASGVDAANLSSSPYTLMPFVRFSFLHFPKTTFYTVPKRHSIMH